MPGQEMEPPAEVGRLRLLQQLVDAASWTLDGDMDPGGGRPSGPTGVAIQIGTEFSQGPVAGEHLLDVPGAPSPGLSGI